MLKFLRRGKPSTPLNTSEQTSEEDGVEVDGAVVSETVVAENITAETNEAERSVSESIETSSNADDNKRENQGFIKKLASKISRTSSSFGDGLGRLLLGKKEIDEELLEEIETQLLMADVGMATTTRIMDQLASEIERDALTDSDALYRQLKQALRDTLNQSDEPFIIDCQQAPFVILVVGVNGAGKTTTIGKLAKRFQNEGLEVMLAAGDTFRAAAVEQLQVWGERNKVPVVAQHTGADCASVIFDALQSAKSRSIDVLIADTAGRLHNKDNLMEELKKVVRVIQKIDPSAPQEILLVLDATTGQNAIAQAEHFKTAVGVSGIAVTKLDGTAKGGVVFAISEQLGLPIRFIGVGEQVDDLRPFSADEFVEALFVQSKN